MENGASKSKSTLTIIVLSLALVIAVLGMGYAATHNKTTVNVAAPPSKSESQTNIDASGFQAVFLTAGQVYFGHLAFQSNGDYKLTDIYYVTNANSGSSNLIKLGNEQHKPKDEMFIPQSSVEFWENLENANQFNGQLR
jgi:amino acid permease